MRLKEERYTKYENRYVFKKIPSDGRTRFTQICSNGFIIISTFLKNNSEVENLKRHESIKTFFKGRGCQFYVLDQNAQKDFTGLYLLVPHAVSASDVEFSSIGVKSQKVFEPDCLIINTKSGVTIDIREHTGMQCEITEGGGISLGEISNWFSGVQISAENIDRF